MSTIFELISQFKAIADDPKKAMDDFKKETGKGAVGIMPVYCPEEIVHAAGYLPIGMWGAQGKADLQSKNPASSFRMLHHAVRYGAAAGRRL